jgi:hypothetical protein
VEVEADALSGNQNGRTGALRRAFAAVSSTPETDQQNQDKRGYNKPGDRDDFDSHFANRWNIVVDVRIAIKESVTVAKDISAE